MSEIPKKYNIDNAKNDIENLQDQNKYDFQEIKRLDNLIKEYDKRVTQSINFNNLIIKKIESDYNNIKKIILDENVSATLDKKIDDNYNCINNKIDDKYNSNKSKIEDLTEQLVTIETKLLNPEMFRFKNGIEVDDQMAINSALNVAYNTSNELHFYKDYNIDQLIIDKNIVCYFHDIKLTNKTEQDVFIEINNQAKVSFKGKLTVISDKCNIGVLNNDSALNVDGLIISNSKKVNVEYRKVNVGGYGEISYLESKLSKVGLYLNTTDTKVNRYQGFCCLTHILNKGGGNFISNAHGW